MKKVLLISAFVVSVVALTAMVPTDSTAFFGRIGGFGGYGGYGGYRCGYGGYGVYDGYCCGTELSLRRLRLRGLLRWYAPDQDYEGSPPVACLSSDRWGLLAHLEL